MRAQVWRQRLHAATDVGRLCNALLECEADASALYDGLPPGAEPGMCVGESARYVRAGVSATACRWENGLARVQASAAECLVGVLKRVPF